MKMPSSDIDTLHSETGSSREAALHSEIALLRKQLEVKQQSASHLDPIANPSRPSTARIALILLVIALAAGAAFFAGWMPRARTESEIAAEARSDSAELPVVTVMRVERADSTGELTLPTTLSAVTEAPVLARADGYVKRRYVDIGDRVSAGQLLAEIDAPELDQNVDSAKATVLQLRAVVEQAAAAEAQGKVQQELARVTAERFGGLLAKGAVSRQENDQYQAQFQAQNSSVQALNRAEAAARGNLAAAEANLARLTQLQSYKQIRAPFAGVITLRNTEVGALIGGGQSLLFRIAQTDRLRAYINVPQSEAGAVYVGETASVQLPEMQGRSFEGKVVRTANALDPNSRTLLTEVQIPNTNGVLMPGVYGQVVLHQKTSKPQLLVPGGTLIIGSQGTQVAVVGPDKRVQIRSVIVGRDFGQTVEVLSGLEEGELVINNPNDDVRPGVQVQPQAASDSSGAAKAPGSQPAAPAQETKKAGQGAQPAK